MTTRTWRMRQWPNDPTIAHLIFVDHHEIPTGDTVDAAVRHARRRGARAIRTSALFPHAAGAVLGCGFEQIDCLALLRRDLDGVERFAVSESTRPLLPWAHGTAAQIDRAAFGPQWGNDATSLRDIRRATPKHRARVIRHRRGMAAFAISGAAGDHGYLQRLAVDPTQRRRGLATSLVVDALRWMQDREVVTVLVNTGRENLAALGLYESLGFDRLDDELVIAELQLS